MLIDRSKNNDFIYFYLLNFARVSDQTNYTENDLNTAIYAINQISENIASLYRVIPLILDKANRLGIFSALSIEAADTLKRVTQEGIVTELSKQLQLKNILSLFKKHNTPVILLKGISFNNLLYKTCAPRLSNDMDLLINKDDLQKVTSFLRSEVVIDTRRFVNVFGDLYENSYIPIGNIGANLDLHTHITYPYLLDLTEYELWERSIPHPLYKSDLVRTLSPEDTLLHLAIHGFKDLDYCKYNIVDTCEVLNQLKPDLITTIERSKKWGAEFMLFILLDCYLKVTGDVISEFKFIRKPNFLFSKLFHYILFANASGRYDSFITIRFKQILAHFIFTQSILRPLSLQVLFIATYLKKKVYMIKSNILRFYEK